MEFLYYFLAGWAGVVACYFMGAWVGRSWPFEEGE